MILARKEIIMGTEYVLKQLLQKNEGWLTLKEVLDQGISKYEFYKFAEENDCEPDMAFMFQLMFYSIRCI